jgi:hypothetical protein
MAEVRLWHGEQGCHVSFCFDSRPERHVRLEGACEAHVSVEADHGGTGKMSEANAC